MGADGLPTGLNGIDNFAAAMTKLQEGGTKWGMALTTADGGFAFRTIYSYLCQQNGSIGNDGAWLVDDNAAKLANSVKVIADWVTNGQAPGYTEYPAAVALFTSGEAAFMINGVWEVPTMVDLEKNGKLFNWGAIELPVMFDRPCTYADSHAFAIPANAGKPATPEKHAGGSGSDQVDVGTFAVLGIGWPHPGVQGRDRAARIQGHAAAGDLCHADRQSGVRSEIGVRRRRLAAV